MKKITALLFVGLVLAAYSPAPLRDKRPFVVKPELSQATVAQQQALQKVQPEVGSVERPVTESLTAPVEVDPEGKDVLRAAPRAGVIDTHSAAEVIERATQDEELAKSRSTTQTWVMIITLLCISGAYGAFRKLADKTIPYAKDQKEVPLKIASRENLF